MSTTTELTKKDLTRAQRKFYDASTPGVKATVVRTLREFGGNTDNFKKWFRKYKKNS